MPAIGPRTVELAAAAGLAGVAVEAGSVLVLGREEAIQAADARGFSMEGLSIAGSQTGGTGSRWQRSGRAIGRLRPGRQARADIDKGLAALEQLAAFQAGSAVVVARAYILAVAAGESVAAMLDRVRALRQWGMRGQRRRGVLVCDAGVAEDAEAVRRLCQQVARQGLAGIAVAGPADALAPYEDAARIADGERLFLVTCRPQ